jgi:dimethylargininase
VQPVHGESHAIVERAREQFGVFTNRLSVAGVACGALEHGGAPQVLCADLAVVFADGAFLMRPSDLRRRAEIAQAEAALARAGVPILGRIEAPGLLDGGDVLPAADTLYIGVARQRRAEFGIPAFVHGNALGREQLAAFARARQMRVVEVPMNADVLRLRSVASLLDAETLVYAPGVIDGTVLGALKLIEAPRGEDYGAGVLTLGPRRVLANLRFRQTTPLLRKAKVAVESIDLWEFGKLGITPSLLALVLKRE